MKEVKATHLKAYRLNENRFLLVSHPHYPLPRTITLASLVKGRWLDGKAQTVALLRFNCDTPAFFIHQTFLPSRRRDCSPSAPSIRFSALSLAFHNANVCMCLFVLHLHYPSKTAITLASPRKRGGGLTALQNRYSTLSSFCNLPDCIRNCYTFCLQDGGDCVCLEDLKIVLLSISIPTVTARNSFRIVKA